MKINTKNSKNKPKSREGPTTYHIYLGRTRILYSRLHDENKTENYYGKKMIN